VLRADPDPPLAGIALGYLLGDIGGEQRAYRQFMDANRSPRRRR